MVHSIKIPAELRKINELEQFLNALFKKYRISRKVYCKIYLSASEAVNNAIIHGSKLDKNKVVEVSFSNQETKYMLTVKDQGIGFDESKIQDPRSIENLRKESGRGIFIMKEYADKVKWEKNGSVVHLTFNK